MSKSFKERITQSTNGTPVTANTTSNTFNSVTSGTVTDLSNSSRVPSRSSNRHNDANTTNARANDSGTGSQPTTPFTPTSTGAAVNNNDGNIRNLSISSNPSTLPSNSNLSPLPSNHVSERVVSLEIPYIQEVDRKKRSMSKTEQSCLQEDLELEFLQELEDMYKQALCSDVCLIVGPEKVSYYVHRNILSARCEYFKLLFGSNMIESNLKNITFLDKSPSDFKILLDFIYTSKAVINGSNVLNILKLADEFSIEPLKMRCCKTIMNLLTDDNLFKIYEESKAYNFLELNSFCKNYFAARARSLFCNEQFFNLSTENLCDLLQSDTLLASELEIFIVSIEWSKCKLSLESPFKASSFMSSYLSATKSHRNNNNNNYNNNSSLEESNIPSIVDKKIFFEYTNDLKTVESLRSLLATVLTNVRFETITPQDIYDFVEPSKVVPKELLLEAYRHHALTENTLIQTSPNRVRFREGSMFFFSGVKDNIPLKRLKGWTCCYRAYYSDKTSESIFNSLKGKMILVGARMKDDPVLAICAMGKIEKVLKETQQNQTTEENGVHWYHWKNHSFGFSSTADILLGSADLADGPLKLSWHLTGRGGYRLGEIRNLNDSDAYEKLIFIY